jgi:hypothetical protein
MGTVNLERGRNEESGASSRYYATPMPRHGSIYTNGNVVSVMARRYILNWLAATTARVVEIPGDSSDDSEAEDWSHLDLRAGNLDVVRRTLNGIASWCKDEGAKGLGRHAHTIRLGRDLWQSAPLSEGAEARIEERLFDDGSLPPPVESKKAVAKLKKADEERPQPFAGRTLPFAALSFQDYGKRISEWFAKVAAEKEPPNQKQLEILHRVKDRVLMEFRLYKEGSDLRRGDPNVEKEEEPLRGFIHGPPGTGKSRVILLIRRFFVEALGWEHGVEFVFVAFQNRVAYAMGGTTLHAGGDIAVGG